MQAKQEVYDLEATHADMEATVTKRFIDAGTKFIFFLMAGALFLYSR